MITQNGVITAVLDDHYRVSVVRQSACSTCNTQSRCGVSALDGLRKQGAVELTLRSAQTLQTGQTVQLGIAETAIIKASLLAYALPLLLLLITATSAQSAGLPVAISFLMSAAALALGFVLARWLGRRSLQNLQPELLDSHGEASCSDSLS
jgi:sigma-E factor negative regulatory protein RseC